MSQKYELINREEGNFLISSMCRWARLPRSGYYSWRDRPQFHRIMKRKEPEDLVRAKFNTSDGTYGYQRITALLGRRGVSVHR